MQDLQQDSQASRLTLRARLRLKKREFSMYSRMKTTTMMNIMMANIMMMNTTMVSITMMNMMPNMTMRRKKKAITKKHRS